MGRGPESIVIRTHLFRLLPLRQLLLSYRQKRKNLDYSILCCDIVHRLRHCGFSCSSHHLLLWETLVSRPAVMDSACYMRQPSLPASDLNEQEQYTRIGLSSRQDYSGVPIDPTYSESLCTNFKKKKSVCVCERRKKTKEQRF